MFMSRCLQIYNWLQSHFLFTKNNIYKEHHTLRIENITNEHSKWFFFIAKYRGNCMWTSCCHEKCKKSLAQTKSVCLSVCLSIPQSISLLTLGAGVFLKVGTSLVVDQLRPLIAQLMKEAYNAGLQALSADHVDVGKWEALKPGFK